MKVIFKVMNFACIIDTDTSRDVYFSWVSSGDLREELLVLGNASGRLRGGTCRFQDFS